MWQPVDEGPLAEVARLLFLHERCKPREVFDGVLQFVHAASRRLRGWHRVQAAAWALGASRHPCRGLRACLMLVLRHNLQHVPATSVQLCILVAVIPVRSMMHLRIWVHTQGFGSFWSCLHPREPIAHGPGHAVRGGDPGPQNARASSKVGPRWLFVAFLDTS